MPGLRVHFIIPFYNAKDNLQVLVDSLAEQTVDRWEATFIDGDRDWETRH